MLDWSRLSLRQNVERGIVSSVGQVNDLTLTNVVLLAGELSGR